ARHQLEQGRLAGAIDAHDAPALLAAYMEVEPVIDRPAAIALGHSLEERDVFAGSRGRAEFEIHGLAALGRLDAIDLVELLHPALHLCGMAGARLEARDEVQFLGQHGLLTLELGLLVLL